MQAHQYRYRKVQHQKQSSSKLEESKEENKESQTDPIRYYLGFPSRESTPASIKSKCESVSGAHFVEFGSTETHSKHPHFKLVQKAALKHPAHPQYKVAALYNKENIEPQILPKSLQQAQDDEDQNEIIIKAPPVSLLKVSRLQAPNEADYENPMHYIEAVEFAMIQHRREQEEKVKDSHITEFDEASFRNDSEWHFLEKFDIYKEKQWCTQIIACPFGYNCNHQQLYGTKCPYSHAARHILNKKAMRMYCDYGSVDFCPFVQSEQGCCFKHVNPADPHEQHKLAKIRCPRDYNRGKCGCQTLQDHHVRVQLNRECPGDYWKQQNRCRCTTYLHGINCRYAF